MAGMLFFSCNKSDDDASSTFSEELIIGTWRWFDETENGISWELTECDTQTTLEFAETGEMGLTIFMEDDFEEGECISGSATGNWEYVGNNIFSVERQGQASQAVVIFSQQNNVIEITDEFEGNIIVQSYERVE